MLPYTHHPNANIEYQMKIEHTTYDAAHKVRARRQSTTRDKIRSFFSIRSDKKDDVLVKKVRSESPSTTAERPARIAPDPANIGQPLTQEDAKFRRQKEEQKALEGSIRATERRERETADSTHVPLYKWTSNKSNASGKPSCRVPADDKLYGKITKRDASHLVKSNSNKIPTTSGSYSTAKCDSREVNRGRLEHAPNKRLDLQFSPINRPGPTYTSKPTPQEPKSLNTSTDLLESTRRDLKLAFNKRTEKFRSSTGLSHKQRQHPANDEDSDSDESFFCSGDPASIAISANKVPSRRSRKKEINPILAKVQSRDSCRLCHIREPAGMRGICIQCENTYCSPQPNIFDDCYEIKPTPPLKIRKKIIDRTHNTRPRIATLDSPSPIFPFRDTELEMLKVYNVGAKPTVTSASLKHYSSQCAVMGNVEPATQTTIRRHPSQRVATGRVEPIGIRRKPIGKTVRWKKEDAQTEEGGSSNYGSTLSSSSGSTEEDKVSLLKKQKRNLQRRKSPQKTDSFYTFYDPLLKDHGARTPKAENSPKRYDRL